MKINFRNSGKMTVLLAMFFLSGKLVFSMDTTCVHQMLIFLQNQQSDGTGNFPKGLFPSYRQYAFRPDILKDDDNFFFTGLILFTLNEVYPKLPESDKEIVHQIRARALPVFALFKNKHGGNTYNFWETNPPEIFPNSGWMNWFNEAQSLPDDMDDTAIGLLAMEADTPTAKAVHQYMQLFTNRPGKPVRNTFKRYKNYPAYSVWFGKKFPVDFDICVLANVLYFHTAYQLPYTQADSASIALLKAMINNKDYLNHPAYISPHYHTTSIILYHLSRLSTLLPGVFEEELPELKAVALKEWNMATNPVAKALLATTLKRWGIVIKNEETKTNCQQQISTAAYSDFVFFIANMASMLPNPLKQILSKSGIGRFNYYCPAYNIALLLENELN